MYRVIKPYQIKKVTNGQIQVGELPVGTLISRSGVTDSNPGMEYITMGFVEDRQHYISEEEVTQLTQYFEAVDESEFFHDVLTREIVECVNDINQERGVEPMEWVKIINREFNLGLDFNPTEANPTEPQEETQPKEISEWEDYLSAIQDPARLFGKDFLKRLQEASRRKNLLNQKSDLDQLEKSTHTLSDFLKDMLMSTTKCSCGKNNGEPCSSVTCFRESKSERTPQIRWHYKTTKCDDCQCS